MFLKEQLSSISFYKSVPRDQAEKTSAGALFSLLAVLVSAWLVLSNVSTYLSPIVHSELIVDQKHAEDKLAIWIDIEFPHMPCTLLSLDLQNSIGLHQLNLPATKYVLSNSFLQATPYAFNYSTPQKNVKQYERALSAGEGCRVKTKFQVDRVPGNFHFSTHPYMEEVRLMNARGTLKPFDYSHLIHKLTAFSANDTNLEEFWSGEAGKPLNSLGKHYIYFLNLLQEDVIDSDGRHEQHYRVRLHHSEEFLVMVPQVLFKYSLSPVNHVFVKEHMAFAELLIRVLSVLGGVFTAARLLDMLFHRSIGLLLEKDRMGKLR